MTRNRESRLASTVQAQTRLRPIWSSACGHIVGGPACAPHTWAFSLRRYGLLATDYSPRRHACRCHSSQGSGGSTSEGRKEEALFGRAGYSGTSMVRKNTKQVNNKMQADEARPDWSLAADLGVGRTCQQAKAAK